MVFCRIFENEEVFMVDDVILNKAATIERCIQRVQEEYQGFEDALETNFTKQDAIILNIQRACEAALDMGTHVVRIEKIGLPQTNREVFALLSARQIISVALGEALQKMIGFRNIAVHDYASLNLEIIQKIIKSHLQDFQKFCQILIQKYCL